jgi:radical SAM superfamily enzyme YgiQ (UPF0313 family)
MVDVLLGQAYYLRFDAKLWKAQQPYAPLGTLYAASSLRAAGHSVGLFDAMLAQSESEWAAALDHHRPRVAAIYEDSFNYLSKMCLARMRQAAFLMIELARARGVPVIVSGSDATDHPSLYLARGAAAVILGEGEAALEEAARAVKAGSPLSRVHGLALSSADGLTRTPPRPPRRLLDELPFPAWDLVDVGRYRGIWRRRHGRFSMNLVTTRGCPYHCNWCAKPIYGQRYAVRSPESVADEMACLLDRYAPDHFNFVDDVFGLHPEWVSRFAAELDRRRLRVPFRCLLRADQVTPDIARHLAAAGCETVWMGAESGSQRVLDAMEKGLSVVEIRTATRRLRDAGIDVGWFLQFGYPGEGWADIEDTLALVRELEPDDIGVSISYPLPGTPFYERVRAELGDKQNWFDSSDLAMMYRATYPTAFYRRLHTVVHREFRARRLARELGRQRPWSWQGGEVLRAVRWLVHRTLLPVDTWRLSRLAGAPIPKAHRTRVRAVLTRDAAATPSHQEDPRPQEATP